MSKDDFFSVSFDLIITDKALGYDLYVNSSSLQSKERFVRIYSRTGVLNNHDITEFKRKYRQLYIKESDRNNYLKSLVHSEQVDDVEKTRIIKDSAIKYLDGLFNGEKEFSSEYLEQTIKNCRDSVEYMADVLHDKNVKEVQELIGNLSFHDFYTYDHSINVSMYCISIYRSLVANASKEEVIQAGLGGLLHDLGKIKIPTHIINFPGKLSQEQFEQIKQHPQYGMDMLDEVYNQDNVEDLSVVRRVVFEHHENYNGTGYPLQLKGEEIHLMARITAIADFFDAITTKRSYHNVLPVEQALQVMSESKGKKIDPKLFDLFVQTLKTFVLSGKADIKLPDNFDPCQPQRDFPFSKVEKIKPKKEYGKVKGDRDIFGKKKKSA